MNNQDVYKRQAVFCMEEVPAQKIAKTKENPAVKAYSDSLSALSESYFASVSYTHLLADGTLRATFTE